ncbi:unnamed protein product [Vicia faba]|uniref:RNase H type-1 domain-containing protein n=1 Tax=Vicia faba TaxID=3906 RepID=A0AAV0YF25_VICFA|nr:unnamed protein product [Vicia faba]
MDGGLGIRNAMMNNVTLLGNLLDDIIRHPNKFWVQVLESFVIGSSLGIFQIRNCTCMTYEEVDFGTLEFFTVLPPDTRNEIMKVHIPTKLTGVDRFGWKHSIDGLYTTTSTYNLLKGSNMVDVRCNWRKPHQPVRYAGEVSKILIIYFGNVVMRNSCGRKLLYHLFDRLLLLRTSNSGLKKPRVLATCRTSARAFVATCKPHSDQSHGRWQLKPECESDGGGVVILDASGRWISGVSSSFSTDIAFTAEPLALDIGLEHAWSLEFNYVLCKTDYLLATEFLTTDVEVVNF